MLDKINPKEITVSSRTGAEKTYVIYEVPAIPSREIAAQYLPSAMPKVGDYKINEAMCYKLMKYVAVKTEELGEIRLTTEALINNHCDFKQLATLEAEAVMHNYGFFLQGTVSTFLETIIQKGQAMITKISTVSSVLSSQMAKPPSTI